MYCETIENDKCRVSLTCDRDCQEMETVFGENHEDAQKQLYQLGWRLYRSKQLCPSHARQISRRLNRQAARAWSV